MRGHDPRLLRFLARHAASGAVAGFAPLLGAVWTNVRRIGALIDRSDIGWAAYLLLAGAFATTGAAVGVAVTAPGRRR